MGEDYCERFNAALADLKTWGLITRCLCTL